MPKLPINYSNTIIYKIVCKDVTITDCYVGHTTSFTKRKNNHKCSCNNIQNKDYKCYLYQFIREHNGWNNWDIIEIEKYDATDKNDACKRERYWIETLQAKLNQVCPLRTLEEDIEYQKLYHQTNKTKLLEYQKLYHQTNKTKLLEKRKIYYEENKEHLLECQKINNEKNKEKYLEYHKLYNSKRRGRI